MKASNIYSKLVEYSYFFNSRFDSLNNTIKAVIKSVPDLKSYKVINDDPVTFSFVTKGELTDDRINQLSEYIMRKQPTYYPYKINRTKKGYEMVLEASYIEQDDYLPDTTETVLSKAIKRKVLAKMRSMENRDPRNYEGASRANVVSRFEDLQVTYSYLDKHNSKDYMQVISDIINNNDGKIKRFDVEGNTIKAKYDDYSAVVKADMRRDDLYAADEPGVVEKEQEYYDYLNKHIGWAVQAFEDLLVHSDEIEYLQDVDLVEKLRAQIKNHDDSKYMEIEFDPYRKHFYPIDDQDKLNTEEYEAAWIHHYTTNPHHWEYWCILNPETGKFELQDDINEEEYRFYEIERICDWISMSKIYNNRVKDWRAENDEEIVQPDFIREFEDSLIDIVHKYELDVNKEDNNDISK